MVVLVPDHQDLPEHFAIARDVGKRVFIRYSIKGKYSLCKNPLQPAAIRDEALAAIAAL